VRGVWVMRFLRRGVSVTHVDAGICGPAVGQALRQQGDVGLVPAMDYTTIN
jgi:hypothetical protein